MNREQWIAEAMRLAIEAANGQYRQEWDQDDARFEALRAHLATVPGPEWLPIETAPKDSTV